MTLTCPGREAAGVHTPENTEDAEVLDAEEADELLEMLTGPVLDAVPEEDDAETGVVAGSLELLPPPPQALVTAMAARSNKKRIAKLIVQYPDETHSKCVKQIAT